MLAKRVAELPTAGAWIFEPKWDGFRALIFRDADEILIQSRDEKSLNRYFPELLDPLRSMLPAQCVLDGEIVIATSSGSRFRGAAAPHSSGRIAREASVATDSGIHRLLRPALRRHPRSAGRTFREPPPGAGIAAFARGAADPSDAGNPRLERRGGLVSALRGRGARRRHGQAGFGPTSPTSA
jgi:hypothetical protein